MNKVASNSCCIFLERDPCLRRATNSCNGSRACQTVTVPWTSGGKYSKFPEEQSIDWRMKFTVQKVAITVQTCWWCPAERFLLSLQVTRNAQIR